MGFKDNKIIIDAYFYTKKGFFLKRLINSIFFKKNHKLSYALYQLIAFSYYLIYYPLFYYLERNEHLFLLHASAFDLNQKGVIIAGLGGIGKSTLALGAITLADECKFLSDNLILYDTKQIYSVQEPIALDSYSKKLIGQTEKYLSPQNIVSSHDRMYYTLQPKVTSHSSVPKFLFWCQWGNTNRVIPIERKKCINNLLNMNLLAREVRQYYEFAATLDLKYSTDFSPDSYFQNLSTLLTKVDCYVLEFKPGVNINTVFNETIGKIIS